MDVINLGVDKGLWEFDIKEITIPEIKDYVDPVLNIEIGEEKVEKTYEDYLAEKERAKEERKKEIQKELKETEKENADEKDNDGDSDSSSDTK